MAEPTRPTEVHLIRSRLGPFELGAELLAISSILDFEEAQGLTLVDPAPFLELPASTGGHVGLLRLDVGPPMGVCLGTVWGSARWTRRELRPLPGWLTRWLPPILKPACGLDADGRVTWFLDLRRLVELS